MKSVAKCPDCEKPQWGKRCKWCDQELVRAAKLIRDNRRANRRREKEEAMKAELAVGEGRNVIAVIALAACLFGSGCSMLDVGDGKLFGVAPVGPVADGLNMAAPGSGTALQAVSDGAASLKGRKAARAFDTVEDTREAYDADNKPVRLPVTIIEKRRQERKTVLTGEEPATLGEIAASLKEAREASEKKPDAPAIPPTGNPFESIPQ